MVKDAKEESLFLKITTKAYAGCLRSSMWVRRIYGDSSISKTWNKILSRLKMWFVSSRIYNIFSTRKDPLAVDDSVLVDHGAKLFFSAKSKVMEFLKTSKLAKMTQAAQKDISSDPFRSLGIIILISVMTNTAISLLLAKKSGFVAWFMRVNFILIGTIWVSCKIELNELKKTSLCYGLIRRRLK